MDCDNKGGQIDKKILGHLKSPRVEWFKQRSGANLSQIWSGLSSKNITIFMICVGQENLIKTAPAMYLTFWYQKCIDSQVERLIPFGPGLSVVSYHCEAMENGVRKPSAD